MNRRFNINNCSGGTTGGAFFSPRNSDVQFVVGGKTYHLHKIVLRASTQLYRLDPQHDPYVDIVSRMEGDTEVFDQFVNYIYNGEYDVNNGNAPDVLRFSLILKCERLYDIAYAIVVNNKNLETSVGLWSLADTFKDAKLERIFRRYILANIQILGLTEGFLKLDSDQIKSFLVDDALNVRSENQVCKYIITWLQYEPDTRVPEMLGLLPCVRFQHVELDAYMHEIYHCPVIANNPRVKRAVNAAYKLANSSNRELVRGVLVEMPEELHFKRPRMPSELAFAFAGSNRSTAALPMETYDVRANQWLPASDIAMMPARSHHHAVIVDGAVYLLGGVDVRTDRLTATVFRVDVAGDRCYEVRAMALARSNLCGEYVEGKIYAIGGYDGVKRLKRVEVFDIKRNTWRFTADMNRPRSDASSAVNKGKIYVAGGYMGTRFTNRVECYDPKIVQWTFISSMKEVRGCFSMLKYGVFLYVIGGTNGANKMKSCERYDTKMKRWEIVTPMNDERSHHSAFVLEDKIYITGGNSGNFEPLGDTLTLNESKKRWESRGDLNMPRYGMKTVVLPNTGELRAYTYYGYEDSIRRQRQALIEELA